MTDRTHPDSGEILDPGIVPELKAEIERLRAELNALRKQEPVVWQKRLNIRDGEWETTQEHDAKWWRDNAKGWEIRALYAAPVPSRDDEEAMRQALEALEHAISDAADHQAINIDQIYAAIAALKERLR